MPSGTRHPRPRRRATLACSALITAFTVAPALAQAPSFTIESALGAPFPSELTAAPAAGRVAWIFNARGSRNVWLGEPGAN